MQREMQRLPGEAKLPVNKCPRYQISAEGEVGSPDKPLESKVEARHLNSHTHL